MGRHYATESPEEGLPCFVEGTGFRGGEGEILSKICMCSKYRPKIVEVLKTSANRNWAEVHGGRKSRGVTELFVSGVPGHILGLLLTPSKLINTQLRKSQAGP